MIVAPVATRAVRKLQLEGIAGGRFDVEAITHAELRGGLVERAVQPVRSNLVGSSRPTDEYDEREDRSAHHGRSTMCWVSCSVGCATISAVSHTASVTQSRPRGSVPLTWTSTISLRVSSSATSTRDLM